MSNNNQYIEIAKHKNEDDSTVLYPKNSTKDVINCSSNPAFSNKKTLNDILDSLTLNSSDQPSFTGAPMASESVNGLMSSDHFTKLEAIEEGAQKNTVTGVRGSNESEFRVGQIEITKENIGLSKVDNTSDNEKNVLSASKLTSARNISISGAVSGSALFDGSSDININIANIDSSKITGIINIDNIPKSAIERCVVVNDDESRFKLTKEQVQKGDTVKVTKTGLLYFVVDDDQLENSNGYEIYNTGSAATVPWSGVTEKPDTFPPATHTHNYAASATPGGDALNAVTAQKSNNATMDADGNVITSTYIKEISVSDNVFTITKGDGRTTVLPYNPSQDNSHGSPSTNVMASHSTNGLMSAAHFTKLEGIEDGAQKNTVTGVKGSNESLFRTGQIEITKENIGLSQVDNTPDDEKSVSHAKTSDSSTNATNATNDSRGQNISETYIKNIRAEGKNVTIVYGNDNTTTFTTQDTNTEYDDASADNAGLMSAAHFTKLEGIEDGAQKNTVTGVKGSSESSFRTGQIVITKENIGLSQVDNTADAEKSVNHSNTSDKAESATTSESSKNDILGQQIDKTYIKSLSVSGHTIQITKGDGSTSSFMTQDTNTSYDIANDRTAGIIKLFNGPGNAEDGSMTQKAITTALSGKSESGHTHNYAGSSSPGGDANKSLVSDRLSHARNISLNGGATGSTTFDGSENAVINVTSIDASKITGIINIDNLPKGALERCIVVKDNNARFALTKDNAQKGDTVKVTETGQMFFIINDDQLSNEKGYEIYTAGSASVVPWEGITNKPETFTPSEHTHNYAASDSVGGSALSAVKASQDGSGNDISSTYVKSLSIDGKQITVTKGNGSSSTLEIPGNDGVSYGTGNATSAGITKLYTGTGSAEDGSMTQKAITTALLSKSESSHTHNYAGSSTPGGAALSAVKANQDATGNDIAATYVKSVTISGKQITVTKGNGTSSELEITDNDTTYTTGDSETPGITKLYTGTGDAEDGSMTQKAITTALSGKSESGHSHNYAGSSTPGGAANTSLSAVKASQDDSGNKITSTYIKSVTISGNIITITKGDGSSSTIEVPVSGGGVSYGTGNATSAGITKLYTGTGDAEDGSMTQKAITDALSGKSESNHTHNYAGSSAPGGAALSAVKAGQDDSGNKITSTYIKTITIEDHTITITKGDGSSSTIEVPDNNTTYSTGNSETPGITKLYTGTGTAEDGSMTQKAITTALSGKSESGHTHNYAGSSAPGGAALSAVKANQDASGNDISSTYVKSITIDDKELTVTKGNGSTSKLTIPVNDVSYSTGNATSAGITKLYTGTGDAEDGSMTQKAITTALSGKSESNHTHNYAASATPGGDAKRALSAGVLSTTQPEYECLWFHKLS